MRANIPPGNNFYNALYCTCVEIDSKVGWSRIIRGDEKKFKYNIRMRKLNSPA
jgi:hypothetical protein